MESAKLSIVATPIGNMQDISFRAITTLKEANIILAEDTRVTKKLLSMLNITDKEVISYNQHMEDKASNIIERVIKNELNAVLVSDAGTPIIADPGFNLVKTAHSLGLKVESIPGPCSIITALTLSGLDCTKFTFNGFFSKTPAKMRSEISSAINKSETQVYFVTKHNVIEVLEAFKELECEREIVLARELTKMNEETIMVDLNNLSNITLKGEYVMVINSSSEIKDNFTEVELIAKMNQLVETMKPKQAAKLLAEMSELSSKDIYAMYINIKDENNR